MAQDATDWEHQSAANRDRWDRYAQEHLRSWYRLGDFRNGQPTVDDIQLADLHDVGGKALLHLQCNAGLDTLSWARRGATVTGVDISSKAVEIAQRLAHETAIPARFLCSDIFDLPATLNGAFDIVYTSQGVLCWLNDLRRWGRLIARLLKPTGVFYIMEEHPFAATLDETEFKLRPDCPYLHIAAPDHEDGATYQWFWSLGDIVNSLIEAGLTIRFLREYDFTFYQRVPYMASDDGRWWRLPGYRLPLMFTLLAQMSPDGQGGDAVR